MPIYGYKCKKCGKKFVLDIERIEQPCSHCGSDEYAYDLGAQQVDAEDCGRRNKTHDLIDPANPFEKSIRPEEVPFRRYELRREEPIRWIARHLDGICS